VRDADIAGRQGHRGGEFRNAGQVCISPTRFLVHKSIANDFASADRPRQGLKVGDGLAEARRWARSPIPRRIEAMTSFTEDAVKKAPSSSPAGSASAAPAIRQPTILSDVPRDAKIFNDEPFGPVRDPALDTLEAAIAEANRLPIGLAGYAFTKSLKNSTCSRASSRWACCG